MKSEPGRRRSRIDAPDEVPGLRRQRKMHAEHVALRRHRFWRRRHGHVEVARQRRRRRRAVALKPPAPHHRRHPERRRAPRHLLPDAAKAKQPERAAIQPARLRVLLLVPASGAQVGDVVGNSAVEREDQSERQLGDGDAVPPGAVRHIDAAPRGASDVNRVDARAGSDDERERAGVEHRLGDRRGSNNEDVGARGSDRAHQRVAREFGLVEDLAPGVFQRLESRRLERVGNEDFHRNTKTTKATKITKVVPILIS